MPYADPERQKEAKRASDQRRAARIAARKKRRYWERVDITRANENERNWRMAMHARMTTRTWEFIRTLTVVNRLELENPVFIFKLKGKTCHENLKSPLPVF